MQQREQYNTPEDFLADESFRNWVLLGAHSQEWESWLQEHPAQAKWAEQARLWLLAMKVSPLNLSPESSQAALETTWQKIAEAESNTTGRTRRLIGFRVAAALLVLVLTLGWMYRQKLAPQPQPITYETLVQKSPEGLIEQTNNTNQTQLLTLSDGSSILLNPNSKLSYPKSFGLKERKVYLSGEAFFEISKNPERPFVVMANEVQTKVLGTSFRIKAYAEQSNVEVLVHTGKVNVSSSQAKNRKAAAVLLLPNQSVRFLRQELAFQKIIESTPVPSAPAATTPAIEQLNFEFTDTPVSDILSTIEKAYQVEIDYPAELLKGCYLNTSLSDQPLPEKLKILCESLSADTRYEMNGNKITILSKGCE